MYHSTIVHGGSFVTFWICNGINGHFCLAKMPIIMLWFDKKMMIGNSSNRGRQQCFLIDIYNTLTIFIGVVLFCFVFSFVSTITTTKSPETVLNKSERVNWQKLSCLILFRSSIDGPFPPMNDCPKNDLGIGTHWYFCVLTAKRCMILFFFTINIGLQSCFFLYCVKLYSWV